MQKQQQPNNSKPKQTHQAPADLQLNLLKLPLLSLQHKPPTNSILSSNSPVNGRNTQERRGLRVTHALFRRAADGRSGIRETELKTRSVQILCVCVCVTVKTLRDAPASVCGQVHLSGQSKHANTQSCHQHAAPCARVIKGQTPSGARHARDERLHAT
ncbi:hypothetical protein ROHU_036658 [Labeo rohita]|uniref:Uncharacterized protein n=1 Tax=Labeo rohita TaxID=84645 RepID=A0A498N4B6_LABRO|nr:hypothetical protein ROHU_036658 [Labeo rohita]